MVVESKSSADVYDNELEKRVIEEMGIISSELAHDLRSPLQTIQNAVFLLEREPENPLFYRLIKDSLKQATKILDNFRDFYKAHLLKLIESDLEKVYYLAVTELIIPENIVLTANFDHIQKIKIDPTKVSIVFKKIIQNSLEAMPEGGKITIKAVNDGNQVLVTISDTGPGIGEEVKKVIYKPFHSELKRGNGLGIPTCKKIVESHGGSLFYIAEESKGTTFTFTLPNS